MIFPGLGENNNNKKKKGSGLYQTVNDTGSEYLRNGSNGFLLIWYIKNFLRVFQTVVVVYYRQIHGNPNLVTQFKFSEVLALKTQLESFSLNSIQQFPFS